MVNSKIHYIYLIQNLKNLKIYVGQTDDLKKRYKDHKYYAKNKVNRPLYNAINNYGIENFSYLSIEEFDNISDANDAEKFWIEYFQSASRMYGYNLQLGGKGLIHKTKEYFSEEKIKFLRNEFSKLNISLNRFAILQKISYTSAKNIIMNLTYVDEYYQPPSYSKNHQFTKTEIDELRSNFDQKKLNIRKLSIQLNKKYDTIYNIILNKTYIDPNYIPPKLIKNAGSKFSDEEAEDIRDNFISRNSSIECYATTHNISISSLNDIINNKSHFNPNYQIPVPVNEERFSLEEIKNLRNEFSKLTISIFKFAKMKNIDKDRLANLIMNRTYFDDTYTVPTNTKYSIEEINYFRKNFNFKKHSLREYSELNFVNHSTMHNIITNKIYKDPEYLPPTLEKFIFSTEEIKNIRNEFSISNLSLRAFSISKKDLCGITTISNIIKNKIYFDKNYVVPIEKIKNNFVSENPGKPSLTCELANQYRKEYVIFGQSISKFAKIKNLKKCMMQNLINNKTYYDPNYIPPNKKVK
jgi:group I intron endonuclease